jgi:trimethylamine--corrinoid protein Co-methyltransferase
MNKKGQARAKPQYRLLTEDQIHEMHQASKFILEDIGVRILHEEALQLLKESGCSIKDENITLIPGGLLEECIQSAPSSVRIFRQTGEEAMILEGRRSYFGTGTDLIRTIDLESGENRLSVLQDVANAAHVSDYCEDVDFIASFGLPSDVPTNTMYLRCVKAMMENSSKPIFFTAAGLEDLAFIHEMASAVAGSEENLADKPFLIHYSEPTAPLSHSFGAINKLFFCAEHRIPICYTAGDLIGGSTPVTLAGAVAQANAESLSGIVLHQLKARGAPIISGIAAVPMDMRTTIFSYGAPDFRLTNSAFADLYHYYGLPMWSTVGTDAHILDAQAGMEHAFGTLMSALDGANLIHDIGYMGSGLLGSPAAIVMCDEIISYVKRIMRGFSIDENTLALDLIREVGQGGNFMAERHTVRNFKNELWQSKHVNREMPEGWEDAGALTHAQRVTRKAKEILVSHQPRSLPDDVKKKLDRITAKAEKVLANFKFQA